MDRIFFRLLIFWFTVSVVVLYAIVDMVYDTKKINEINTRTSTEDSLTKLYEIQDLYLSQIEKDDTTMNRAFDYNASIIEKLESSDSSRRAE